MMKKLFIKVMVLVFFIFSFVVEIKAESEGGFNLIYHVTNLDVSGSNMTFNGFAFIDHMDNRGGDNLHTFIRAYAGDGTKIYEKPVTYKGADNFSYYMIRCQGDGCFKKYDHNLSRNSDSCNKDGNADCIYYNVDFEVTISLNEIVQAYKNQGKTGNISLGIYSENGTKHAESKLGVYAPICKGSCDDVITVGDSTVKLANLNNDIEITATDTNKRYFPSFSDTGVNFGNRGPYRVEQYITNYPVSIPKTAVSPRKEFRSNIFVVGGGYAVYDSWVQMPQGIEITFGDPPPPPPELPSGCEADYNNFIVDTTLRCGGNRTMKVCIDTEVSLNNVTVLLPDERKEETWNPTENKYCSTEGTVNLVTDIFIHEKGDFSVANIGQWAYAGRGFSFPDLKYNNTIFWKYARSGDNIAMKTATITYTPVVEERVGDEKPRNADGSCPAGYEVAHWNLLACYGEKVKYKCGESTNYSLTNDEIATLKRKGSDKTLLKELEEKSSEAVKGKIIDGSNYSKSVVVGSVPIADDSNEYPGSKDTVSGEWKRTGANWFGSIIRENSENNSQWQYDFWKAYVKLTGSADEVAKVFYSQTPLDGDDYSEGFLKYFVPLHYPDNGIFNFDVRDNDVNFINDSDIRWNIEQVCPITITNIPFDGYEPKFYYRPIDISIPFPEGNNKAPVNWRNWINIPANVNRLESSYNPDKKNYSVVLKKGESSGNILGIAELNKNVQNYNTWDMDVSGASNYLSDLGSKLSKTDISYCKIGEFSESCNG